MLHIDQISPLEVIISKSKDVYRHRLVRDPLETSRKKNIH